MYSVKERGILSYSYSHAGLCKTFKGFLNVDFEAITTVNAVDLITDNVTDQIVTYAKSEELVFTPSGDKVIVELYDSRRQGRVGKIVSETELYLKKALEEFIDVHTENVHPSNGAITSFKLIRGHLYEAAHEAVIQMKLAQKQLGLGKDVVGLICRYIWSTRRDEEWTNLMPKTKRAKLNM
jgi:hypothetical protein